MKNTCVNAALFLAVLLFAAASAFAEALPAGGSVSAVPAAYKNLSTAAPEAGYGIRLSWETPKDVASSVITGYRVYRSDSITGHYEPLNKDPLKVLLYDDKGLVKGKNYYYKVASVFEDGSESGPTPPVGMTAGAAPGTPAQRLPVIKFFTSDALGKVTYLDEEAVFILEGDPGLTGSFDIQGVAQGLSLNELQPGTYKGMFKVTEGLKVRDTYAVATLSDKEGGRTTMATPATISLLSVRKPALKGFYAGILESDRVGLNWPKMEDAEGYYNLYKDTGRIVGLSGVPPLSANMDKGVTAYIDTDVGPGTTYYYVLSFTSISGEVSYSENLEVKVPEPGHVSGIETVEEDSGGRVLKPGDTLTVTVKTSPGGKAFFTLGTAVRDKEMAEVEPGVYRAGHTVREGDGVFKVRVSVSFRDSSGGSHFTNSATFVSVDAPRLPVGQAALGRKPLVYGVSDNIQLVAGSSGRLTAGKTFTVTLTGEPGNKAFFCVGDGIWKVPMKEQPGSPGTYTGDYTVRPGDSAGMSPDPLKTVYVTGYLESPSGALSDPASGLVPVVIDTTVNIKVEVSSGSLPADARSQSKVAITVTDADGEPVVDRRLSVLLEPPPSYTGVVGSGGMASAPTGPDGQAPRDLGRLEVDFDNLTDTQGGITATYTSGFAAKTAMIVVRDFSTGSVGMGYITTSISSSVNVLLEEPVQGGGVVTPPEPVYQLQVDVVPDPDNPVRTYEGFVVEAVPDTLTADGVSRANIIATLTKDGVPVQGNAIIFSVTGAGGSLTKSSDVTDAAGRAQVFYIAGTKAGKALITATEATTGISVTKVVTLLPDAPAKIYVKAYPDTLPADGASASRVVVEVADINDNPTDNVSVVFTLEGGPEKGQISMESAVTDARGACDFVYTAGTQPGVATIDVTAASKAPTEEELSAACSRVIAPLVYDNSGLTELTVLKWYKSEGDNVGKGEPLALVGTPLGDMVVYSPVTGVLDKVVVEQGVNVMEGKEIGIMR